MKNDLVFQKKTVTCFTDMTDFEDPSSYQSERSKVLFLLG